MPLSFNSFCSWAAGVLPAVPVEGVVAYNFNIAESAEAFEVEVVGSSYFDPGNPDWACDEAWTSRPSKYLVSYLDAGRSWEAFQDWVAAAVRGVCASGSNAANTLNAAVAVTVGFVDGELTTVGGRDV